MPSGLKDFVRRRLLSFEIVRKSALRTHSAISRFQGKKRVHLYGVDLEIPSRHPLESMLREGPREQLLATISRYAFSETRNHYLDVGANVGDTATLIESCSNFQLESDLIEPSTFFLPYLKTNSKLLFKPTIHEAFAANQHPPQNLVGEFHHWPGNAEVVPVGTNLIAAADEQINIADLIGEKTGLVKVDCEGQDISILTAMLKAGLRGSPVLYFESTLRSQSDLQALQDLFRDLGSRYPNLIATDPTGLLLFGGGPNEAFFDLCRYQISVGAFGAQHKMYYFDVSLYPARSKKIFETALEEARSTHLTTGQA